MADHMTITATVAVWLPASAKPHELLDLIEKRDSVGVISKVWYYGKPDRERFADQVRIGEADVILRLAPHDEQVAAAVASLKADMDKLRAAYLQRQQEILAEISKLTALPMGDVVEAE